MHSGCLHVMWSLRSCGYWLKWYISSCSFLEPWSDSPCVQKANSHFVCLDLLGHHLTSQHPYLLMCPRSGPSKEPDFFSPPGKALLLLGIAALIHFLSDIKNNLQLSCVFPSCSFVTRLSWETLTCATARVPFYAKLWVQGLAEASSLWLLADKGMVHK